MVKPLSIRINKYSAINKIAKTDPTYSELNPETNSLSPSAKSYGERLLSASSLIIQIYNNEGNIIQILIGYTMVERAMEWWNTNAAIRIKAILTS